MSSEFGQSLKTQKIILPLPEVVDVLLKHSHEGQPRRLGSLLLREGPLSVQALVSPGTTPGGRQEGHLLAIDSNKCRITRFPRRLEWWPWC